jgi:release factor glutamine methyltransferase
VSGTRRTLGELLDAGAGELRRGHGSAREDPRREASLLLGSVLGLDQGEILSRPERPVEPGEAERYRDLVRRRARGRPLQLLLGVTGFHDVTLAVEPGVFIPRPETELLVEQAVAEIRRLLDRRPGGGDRHVLDLCTGTGAVAVAVAWSLRDAAGVRVHAGDSNPAAVDLARKNADRAGVTVDVRFSDLGSAFADLDDAIDVLVANPPYIPPEESDSLPPEVRLGDPAEALFDPEGGTGFHRRIAGQGRSSLRAGGLLALEIGWSQGAEAAAILGAAGYEDVAVLPDLAGRDRVVRGRRPSSTPSW